MLKHKLVDFIIQFMEEVDKEISEMKLFVCLPRFFFASSRSSILTAVVERTSKICSRVLLDTCEYNLQIRFRKSLNADYF